MLLKRVAWCLATLGEGISLSVKDARWAFKNTKSTIPYPWETAKLEKYRQELNSKIAAALFEARKKVNTPTSHDEIVN